MTGGRDTRPTDPARRMTDDRGGRITCPEMAAVALLLGAFVTLVLAIVTALR